MVQLVDTSNPELVALKLTGKINKEEYDAIIPTLEEKIKDQDKVRLFCEIDDLDGITPKALWEDLKFDIKHFNDFKKVAVVGDQEWMSYMTAFAKPFVSADVEYFSFTDRNKALDWVTR
jgi:hypothetical protein